MPQAQVMYDETAQEVRDPETGEFYHKRDKNGNIIKGTGPRHLIRQIVRIRTMAALNICIQTVIYWVMT